MFAVKFVMFKMFGIPILPNTLILRNCHEQNLLLFGGNDD